MLPTVKGYYDHGQIILKEKAPVETKTDVIVTFLSEETKIVNKSKRILGLLQGKITISDAFDDPLEDMKEYH